jgi:hypothetical protein
VQVDARADAGKSRADDYHVEMFNSHVHSQCGWAQCNMTLRIDAPMRIAAFPDVPGDSGVFPATSNGFSGCAAASSLRLGGI